MMPDVIIKGMEMPSYCLGVDRYSDCPMDRTWCIQRFAPEGMTMGQAYDEMENQLPEWCPLAPANGWIPADKPPRPGERVLLRAGVFVGEGYFTSAHTWRRITGMPMRDITDEPVTEWMPLPEVPE